MVRITKDKRHDILKDGIRIGQIYLARAESRKLRYWATLGRVESASTLSMKPAVMPRISFNKRIA